MSGKAANVRSSMLAALVRLFERPVWEAIIAFAPQYGLIVAAPRMAHFPGHEPPPD
jgi:hypothetical protein